MFSSGWGVCRHLDASYSSSGNARLSPSSSWEGFNVFQYCEMPNICQKGNKTIFALFCLIFYWSYWNFLSKDKISRELLAEKLYTADSGIWLTASTLNLWISTITRPCKPWCSEVGGMWVSGCLWLPALVLKTRSTSPCYSAFPCGVHLGGGATETPFLWDIYNRACGISQSWAQRKLWDRRKLKRPPCLNAYTKDHAASSSKPTAEMFLHFFTVSLPLI